MTKQPSGPHQEVQVPRACADAGVHRQAHQLFTYSALSLQALSKLTAFRLYQLSGWGVAGLTCVAARLDKHLASTAPQHEPDHKVWKESYAAQRLVPCMHPACMKLACMLREGKQGPAKLSWHVG